MRETSTSYSLDHHGITVTNGSGANAIITTSYTDNEGKGILSVANPSASVLDYTLSDYNRAGNLSYQEHDSSSNSVVTAWTFESFDYDGLNRLTSKIDRDGALTYFDYDAAGNLTNRVMPGGLQWNATYNSAGQMLKEWNSGAEGTGARTNTFTYYATGNAFSGMLETSTDGIGAMCTHYYDDWFRPVMNVYENGTFIQGMTDTWEYDVRGFQTTITEDPPLGGTKTIQRTYDAYGQLTSENGASQSWDAAGRRTGLQFETFGYNFSWRADGLVTAVSTPVGTATYAYDSAGLLTNRTAGSKTTSIGSRDGEGRPLSTTTKVSGSTALSESLSYTGDGLLSAHTLTRSDFTDQRTYGYTNLTRRLVGERLNINASTRWTNTFDYDNGSAAGPGALTLAGVTPGNSAKWIGNADAFSRISNETNTVAFLPTYGRANGPSAITVMLDGQLTPVRVETNGGTAWPRQWYATLELTPGAHQLTASAAHPSGLFVTNVVSWFTNGGANETVADTYDAAGYLTFRTWKNVSGQTNRIQGLFWDHKGRLVVVIEKDRNNNGYFWEAYYDGLNRRVRTLCVGVTNGQYALSGDAHDTSYSFDPQVEFLELGVTSPDWTTWKIYGPDLNGRYGGMNGVGGLDAVSFGPNNPFSPVVSDARGNVLASVTNGVVSWNPSRPTGYGAVPNYRPIALGYGADVVQASAWRGHYADISGLIWLGARCYDPVSGRFFSSDPTWNGRDPNYYSFCGGDPINHFDADGRLGNRTLAFVASGFDFDMFIEGTRFDTAEYANAKIRNYEQQRAEYQWYQSLPRDQQDAYRSPLPFVFNLNRSRDAMASGDYGAAVDSAGRVGVEALMMVLTARLYPEAPQMPQRAMTTPAAETIAAAGAPGAKVAINGVNAIELGGRLSPADMAALQQQHQTEFAQIYKLGPGPNGGGGTYYLIQGTQGTVPIPISSDIMWISHTHPEMLSGGLVPLTSSAADQNVLSLLQQAGSPQRTSLIVPETGQPFTFKSSP